MFTLNLSAKTRLLSGASLIAIALAIPAQATTLSGLSKQIPVTAIKTTSTATGITSSTTAGAAAATVQSTQDYTNALAAIRNQMAAQAAAHNAAPSAAALAVPNGLAAGGLVPDSGLASNGSANTVITWIGANTPTQATSGTTTVTITQTQEKAIANWSSFNVGVNTTVHFDQSAGNSTASNGSLTNSWVILNRVNNSVSPTQIFGTIKAEGSVYLLDSNGILFGASSQVNVHSLVASSLNLFSNDLTVSNYRFLNGGIGDLNSANVATNSILLTSSAPGAGNITIDQGAEITGGDAGLILIAAPNVTNKGTISAPAGQIALIAGIGVSYDYNYSNFDPYYGATGETWTLQAYNDNSTTFLDFANYGELTDANGNDITPVGKLINNGLISTPRGNITLLGGAIEQNGLAVATTSVKQPGSIVIESLYEVGTHGAVAPLDEGNTTYYTGSVSFGPQAVTAVMPDTNGVTLASDATSLAPWKTVSAAGSKLPTQGFGEIYVTGQAIDFQGGSLTYAPGQAISASTVVLLDPRTSVPAIPGSGRVFVENGAALDVSGMANIELPDSYNLLTVKLAGNELADDPNQQDGFLYGQTITVDMRISGTNSETGESWVGTPLANLASYANLQQNLIDQLLVNGGTINLRSNEVVAAPGSIINLMGGYTHILGGTLNTTKLVNAAGNVVDISKADPNDTYVGFAGQSTDASTRWGVSSTSANGIINSGTYEPDYIQGGNAGSLNIGVYSGNGSTGTTATTIANSGALVLDGALEAGALAGTRQVEAGTLPTGGSFTLYGILPIEIGDPGVLSTSSQQAESLPSGFTMSSPLLVTKGSVYANGIVLNSQSLDDANFANITLTTGTSSVSTSGAIVEDAGTALVVQPGGSITLSGGNVTINGDLTARAGTISITTEPEYLSFVNNVPGDIVIGPHAVLDVSGLFANDARLASDQTTGPVLVNAGSISLITDAGVIYDAPQNWTSVIADLTGNISLAKGSVLDLDGGGRVLKSGKLQTVSSGAPAGSGGNLTLETYANMGAPPTTTGAAPTRGVLTLDGTIRALGMSGGGTLTLQTIAFQVGGDSTKTPSYATYFDPTAWGNLGFAGFNLSSVLQTEIPAGATVRLTHENLLPDYATIVTAPSGADPTDYGTAGYLTGTLLSPTNLSITAGLEEGYNYNSSTPSGDDAARVDTGAQILADPGASISINSDAMVDIDGTIRAPGGSISVTINYPNSYYGAGPLGPLYLGPDSVLDVSGTTVVNPLAAPVLTANGWVTPHTGKILAGGTVNLKDDASPILVASGAVINVSGTSGYFDVAQLASGSLGTTEVLTREPEWSDAGQVNIGSVNLLFEGTLKGNAGASPVAGDTRHGSGGTLTIAGDANAQGGNATLILVQDTADAMTAAGIPFDFSKYVPKIASYSTTIVPGLPRATVLVGVDKINGSGFSNLTLQGKGGAVGFAGNVSLTVDGSFVVDTLYFAAANAGNFAWGYAGPTLSTLSGGSIVTTGDASGVPASLTVNAPYIEMSGLPITSSGLPTPFSPPWHTGDATMTLNANQIDIAGVLYMEYIGQATFNSSGDIRLLPTQYAPTGGGTQLVGYLLTEGNLTFNAADIYPATDTAFVIEAVPSLSGSCSSNCFTTTVTFGYPTGVSPSSAAPLSANGTLLVDANAIVQDGEIQAPFGSIILGLADTTNGSRTAIADALGGYGNVYSTAAGTQSVTLGAGSVTSVSANGQTIPYGSTVDQTTWIYDPLLDNPTWDSWISSNYLTAYTVPLTTAPQGIVRLTGDAVLTNSGAVINLDGGGDLQAQEWVPGTGGSRNVLLQYQTSYQNSTSGQQVPTYSDARQIYAIVPGYSKTSAPYDSTLSQSGLSAGQSVYLSGGDGLAAGVYTLLPAQYATLPGAYRVVVNSGVTNPLVTATQTLADGTAVMTGYLTNSITGARGSTTEQFQVQSASVWEKYSQYALTSADSFFPKYATTNDLPTPYIPADAGRLVLAAINNLTLDATLKGAAGAGGTGAQVDISGQYLEIVDSGSGQASVTTGALNFNSPNTTNVIPAGTAVSFGSGVALNDIFTITGNGTLVVPSGATATQLISSGASLTANAQSVSIPSGDTIRVTSRSGQVTVGTNGIDTVTNPSSIGLPVSSTTSVTLSNTLASLKYSYGSGSGGSAITITSTAPFTVAGVRASLSTTTGLYTSTTYSANQAVKGTVANQVINWTTGTSGSSSSLIGAGGTLSVTGSTTATLGTTLATGSTTYTLPQWTYLSALSQSDLVTGTFSVSGSNPVGEAMTSGTYTVTSGGQYSNISAGANNAAVTFTTGSVVDTLAYTGGTNAVALPTSQTFLLLNAKQLDAWNATSLLIGGTRSSTPAGSSTVGTVITPTANTIYVANDANAPLTAPEILLVAAPQFQKATLTLDTEGDAVFVSVPISGTGKIVMQSGSVIKAEGTVGSGASNNLILGSTLPTLPILPTSYLVSQTTGSSTASNVINPTATAILTTYYSDLDAALGTLVRVSNGAPVTVQLPSTSLLNPGSISVTDNVTTTNPVFTINLPSLSGVTGLVVQMGAQLIGGNALTLASTGDSQVQAGALLSGTNVYANSSQITFVGSGTAPTSGMVIDANALAALEKATNLDLQSESVIAFQGNVALQISGSNSLLTLGAGALTSDGGTVSISAPTVVLDNELNAPVPGFAAGNGSLAISANELVFGNGAKTLSGFDSISLTASKGVVGQGTGSMDFGNLAVALQTPVVIADTGSTQTLSTTGALSVVPVSGAALTSDAMGGAISLQGGSITISVPIDAVAGNIGLTAGSGDITVTGTGSLIANGVEKQFVDVSEYADAGNITLTANQGNVNIQSGAVVDFAGAASGGNAGSLTVTAPDGALTLAGTIQGSAASGEQGGAFSLDVDHFAASGSLQSLDDLAKLTANAGVTDAVIVHTRSGNLVLDNGDSLQAGTVSLTADSKDSGPDSTNGNIVINGTINASGTSGGTIQLFGASGVTVAGNLSAEASKSSQRGGDITIGTSSFSDGTTNADGSNHVTASGTITVASTAKLDVSGGASATGGTVTFRAPILDAGNNAGGVNLSLAGTIDGSRSTVLEADRTWTASAAGVFDGIIDPQGVFNSSTAVTNADLRVNGTWYDEYGVAGGNVIGYETNGQRYQKTSTYSSTVIAIADDGASGVFVPTAANQSHINFVGTLEDFVQNFSLTNASSLPTSLALRPGVQLVNNSTAVNAGSISILGDLDLGQGTVDPATGLYTGNFRVRTTGQPGILNLIAVNNILFKDASISDGFYASNAISTVNTTALAQAVRYENDLAKYQAALLDYQNALYNYQLDPGAFTTYYGGSLPAPTPPTAPTPPSGIQVTAGETLSQLTAQFSLSEAKSLLQESQMPASWGDTWSYRVVAGAATGSANPLSVQSAATFAGQTGNAGNVILTGHELYTYEESSAKTQSTTSQDTYTYPNYGNYYMSSIKGMKSTSIPYTLTTLGRYGVETATVAQPSMLRTGTGSIEVAAANDIALTDPQHPDGLGSGDIYTAGTPTQTPTSGYTTIVGYHSITSTFYTAALLTAETNPTGGGNVTLSAQDDIIGVELATDVNGTLTGTKGNNLTQLWTPWLLTDQSNNSNVVWYVNFGSFDQGVMSIGGNVTITAGGNIKDLGVSLPTTAYLNNGTVIPVGSGNLSVTAGGSILSGDFYVGNGSGAIRAGDMIASDIDVPSGGSQYASPVATVLAVQYGTIAVDARGSVDIGGVYDPTYMWSPSMSYTLNTAYYTSPTTGSNVLLVPYVTSMSTNSGVSIQATSGAVTFNSLLVESSIINDGSFNFGVSSLLLPASLNVVALDGGINVDHGGGLYPSATGTLSLIADQSINLAIDVNASTGMSSYTSVGNVFATTLEKLDYPVGAVDAVGDAILPTTLTQTLVNVWNLPSTQTNDPSLIKHSATDLVHVIALNGSLIDGTDYTVADGQINIFYYDGGYAYNRPLQEAYGGTINQISLIPNAPAEIYAGKDILDLPFYGENFTAADVTSIVAGGDIRYNVVGDEQSPAIELAGPGHLVVVAGGSISFPSQRQTGASETGIRTLGNLIDTTTDPILGTAAPSGSTDYPFYSTTYIADFGNPYLPAGGASVNVLFGVGPGIDYADFAAKYVNPAQGASVIADEPSLLTNLVASYEKALGKNTSGLTADQAWSIYATMPDAWQHLIDDQIFLDVLNETGLDYNNPDSSHFNQYARGYQAINTLFPSAYGYTQNDLVGGTNGANKLVVTGNLDIRGATIQTQQGGDISLFGPGGRVLVGSTNASPAVNPASEGVLTLESGNISTFSDTDVLVAQSRIMTEQGGDILMWSSNGNLDAGKGAKTSVSFPPPKYACDLAFYCIADLKGEVSGAGIATLQSLPGVPVGDANLIAPRGTVDAGAAGIRVSGNLNIASLYVANVFNITVQGKTIGIPVLTTNINLATVSNAATEATTILDGMKAKEPQNIIDVEVTGYGGEPDHPERCIPSPTNDCRR